MAAPRELFGDRARGLGSPLEQAHRIPRRGLLHDSGELALQCRLHFLDSLASTAGAANSAGLRRQHAPLAPQFRRALVDRRSRHPGQLAQPADSAAAKRKRLLGNKQARLRLVERAEHSQPALLRIRGRRPRSHAPIVSHAWRNTKNGPFCKRYCLATPKLTFITLRRRSKSLLAEVERLPASAWRRITLDVPHRKYRTPRVHEQKVCPRSRTYRQFYIKDLGHEEPTILLTNDAHSSAKQLITRYAKRMLIENALADAVRFFHMDALSSSVGFKVDFDMALLVLASGLYRLMARRMRGYDDAQARQIFRDLIDMPADVTIDKREIRVRFHRRAHLPIVLASGLIDKPVKVPWWNGQSLRLVD